MSVIEKAEAIFKKDFLKVILDLEDQAIKCGMNITRTKKSKRGRPFKIEGKARSDPNYQKQYSKQYYDEHKVKLLNYFREKVECPLCGIYCNRNTLNKHKQSEKCHKYAYEGHETKTEKLKKQYYNLVKHQVMTKRTCPEIDAKLKEILLILLKK